LPLDTTIQKAKTATKWIYVSECLYRKCAGGTIYIRTQHNCQRTLRSTETADPIRAKKVLDRLRAEQWTENYGVVLPGLQVQERKISVKQLIADYVTAGHPTKKMQKKVPGTVRQETNLLKPVLEWWGDKNPSAVTFSDCDKYRTWRNSGAFIAHFKIRGHDVVRHTKGGDRIVDLELDCLSSVFHLARRCNKIKHHPLLGRGKYVSAADIRHCREVAPDPQGLKKLAQYFRARNEDDVADCILFMAYTGLRIGEALGRRWGEVNYSEGIMDVKRKKRGIYPWVTISAELKALLTDMQRRREAAETKSELLFPSPFDPSKPRDHSAVRTRITTACRTLKISHVTPHGLRSYFVTSARESGLTDAEIAMLIGDKSGPALIATTYGDVRPEHLVRQAHRINFQTGEPKV